MWVGIGGIVPHYSTTGALVRLRGMGCRAWSVDRRRGFGCRVPVVLHRQAPARGRDLAIARDRTRFAVRRSLAPVPVESRPAARRHRPARHISKPSSAARERARQIYARVGAAGATRRHSVRVRRDRAPAQHARCASADRVGAGAATKAMRMRSSKSLFRAYFLEGAISATIDELVSSAEAARFDADDARAFLESDDQEAGRRRRPTARERARRSGRAVLHLRRQDGGVGRA